MMGNFRRGRTQVGELLLSMLVQDLGTQEHTILIEGDAVRAEDGHDQPAEVDERAIPISPTTYSARA